MQVYNIYRFLDKNYNFNKQDKNDNSGVFFNHYEEIESIIVCLEITKKNIHFAIENNIKLIISHHPLFEKEETTSLLNEKEMMSLMKENSISCIFLHTPYDKSNKGMNFNLAEKLNLSNIRRLPNDDYIFCGDLDIPIQLDRLAKKIKLTLNSDHANFLEMYAKKPIYKIAICGGSGSNLMWKLRDSNIDLYITCDVKHHAWADSISENLPILELNHCIENDFVDIISNKLLDLSEDFDIFKIKTFINKIYY